MKKLLAIDGGGIRGLIPALVLQHIEECLGKPCAEIFDAIAGTSVGGILALGLTRRNPSDPGKPLYSAAQLVDLLRDDGPRIFSRSLGHQLLSLWGLTGPKYPATGPKEVLEKYFQDALLSTCLKPTLALAYEIDRRSPFFFRSWRASQPAPGGPAYDFAIADVARATSAAPTYFPPAKVASRSSEQFTLVDGGVFANNPALCLYIDFIREIDKGYRGELLIVSVGTGNPTRPIRFRTARRWGIACWARPLIDIFIDGAGDATDFEVREALSAHEHFRFQGDVPQEAQALDDTSPATLEVLEASAKTILKNSAPEMAGLCELLRG